MTREQVAGWLGSYERAWRSAGTDSLRALFTEDATYRLSPYEQPFVGLAAIGQMWEAERQGPEEMFTMASEIVAVEGDTAVIRVEVRYGNPVDREYRDLWIVSFADDGRALAFEEWPFQPGQPYAAPPGALHKEPR